MQGWLFTSATQPTRLVAPQGKVLEQQVEIHGLKHQLLEMHQTQRELVAAHAASLSTVKAELLAACDRATLQVCTTYMMLTSRGITLPPSASRERYIVSCQVGVPPLCVAATYSRHAQWNTSVHFCSEIAPLMKPCTAE